METAQSPLAHLGDKQVLASLHYASEDQLRYNDSAHEETTQSYHYSKMIIDNKYAFIIRNHNRVMAAMARPSDAGKGDLIIRDKDVIIADCCAAKTLTGSLLNTTTATEKVTISETADGRDSMKASH